MILGLLSTGQRGMVLSSDLREILSAVWIKRVQDNIDRATQLTSSATTTVGHPLRFTGFRMTSLGCLSAKMAAHVRVCIH